MKNEIKNTVVSFISLQKKFLDTNPTKYLLDICAENQKTLKIFK